MDLRIISVPYDSGLRETRMGVGPGRLLAGGLTARLRRALPVVLAGNCVSAVGTLAGLGPEPVGVLWFDAHGDFNTSETTTGGFLDGMALAIATGYCWRPLAGTIAGFRPVSERRVTLVGTRDLDPAEAGRLRESGIAVVEPAAVAERLPARLAALRSEGTGVYLHVDLDVLDPGEGRANGYAVPGGLTLPGLVAALAAAGALPVRAVAFTAYDPGADPAGRIAAAAAQCLAAVVRAAAHSPRAAEPSAAADGV